MAPTNCPAHLSAFNLETACHLAAEMEYAAKRLRELVAWRARVQRKEGVRADKQLVARMEEEISHTRQRLTDLGIRSAAVEQHVCESAKAARQGIAVSRRAQRSTRRRAAQRARARERAGEEMAMEGVVGAAPEHAAPPAPPAAHPPAIPPSPARPPKIARPRSAPSSPAKPAPPG